VVLCLVAGVISIFDSTLSELNFFFNATRRSRISSVNAGLSDLIPAGYF
jgi:hypothetical protein